MPGIEGLNQGSENLNSSVGRSSSSREYCISVMVPTFQHPSHIYGVRPVEIAVAKGWPFARPLLVAGHLQ
jgi:hypothetical protein